MWAAVYALDRDGKELRQITSGVTFKVLARGADTSETLTYYGGTTSLTNPVTTTNFAADAVCGDRVAFRTDPTDTSYDRYVDLIVVDTAGGFTAFVEDFDKYQHTIVIDERPGIMHHGCIWWSYSDNTATDTGVDFLIDTAVSDVWVEVVTVDATETISVGTADTATGFRSGVSVATAGYPTDTAVITGGTNIDYVPVTTYGALLVTAITGNDAVATCGGKSYIGPHIVKTTGTDDDLYYTGSAGSDAGLGYIHYWFTRIR